MSQEILEPITTTFEPEKWSQYYQDDMAREFAESYYELAELEELEDEEAEQKLLQILMKVTLVERHLIVNGAQTAEQLFEQMQNELFASPAEILEFCSSMSPVFLLSSVTGKFRNSGHAFRLFIQELYKKIEGGEEVNEENIRELCSKFSHEYSTVKRMTNEFKKLELLLDMPPLKYLPKLVAGFEYDSGSLKLSTAEHKLGLRLEILAHTMDTLYQMKVDKSRVLRGKFQVTKRMQGLDLSYGHFVDHPVLDENIKVCIKGKNFDGLAGKFCEMYSTPLFYVEGYISPNAELPNKNAPRAENNGAPRQNDNKDVIVLFRIAPMAPGLVEFAEHMGVHTRI